MENYFRRQKSRLFEFIEHTTKSQVREIGPLGKADKPIRWLLTIWALSGIMLAVAAGLLYLRWDGFSEQGEVTFSAVSWLLYKGCPLYTALDAADRYSLQHGPNIYLVIGGVMKLLGPSYMTAKLANVLALFLVILFSWLWLSKLVKKQDALWLVGLESWLLLHWHYSFAARPDSLMLLCVTVSMYIVTTARNRLLIILGTGISLGLIINLKVHGIFYLLPIILIAYQQLNRRSLVAIAAVAMSVAIGPFLLPQVSFVNYMLWLTQSAHMGISLGNVLAKVVLVFELSMIGVAVGVIGKINLRRFYQQHRTIILILLGSLIVPAIVGSKPGSGTNHLMPYIPVYIYIMSLLAADIRAKTGERAGLIRTRLAINLSRAFLIALLILVTISGVGKSISLIKPKSNGDRAAVIQELLLIEKLYSGMTMEVGYGEERSLQAYRDYAVLLVFHGNPYLVDKVALGDMRGTGLPVPDATIDKVKEGAVKIWLIPADNTPFAIHEFDESFREAFFQNYRLTARTRYFDIWIHYNNPSN